MIRNLAMGIVFWFNVYLLVTPTDIEYFNVSQKMMKTFDNCSSSDLCGQRKCDKSDPYNELWNKKSIKTQIHTLSSQVIHSRI